MHIDSMYTLMKQKYTKHKKLKYLIVVCACLVYIFRLCLLNAYRNDVNNGSKVTKRRVLDQSIHEPKRIKTNIFFIDTSCFTENVQSVVNPRQACAIESAAAANLDHMVYFLYTCAFDRFNLPYDNDYVSRLFLFPNVRFLRLNVTCFVEDTPVEDWWKAGGMKNSNFSAAHVSELLKLVALWKYGGTYMDLDFIVLRSLNGLSNFIGAESQHSLASGIMNSEPDGIGHEIVTECLEDMKRSFNGSVRAMDMATAVAMRVLSRRCGISEPAEMTRDRCGGFSVLPPKTFYPISWTFWQLYFAQQNPVTNFPLSLMTESVAVHIWNNLSGDVLLNVGSNRTYALIAERYCPRVYKHCGPVF